MPKESKVEKNIVEVQQNGNFMMNDKQYIGLIPNVSYNAFILGSNVNMYLNQEHTKKMYDEATFSNISYFLRRKKLMCGVIRMVQ